jgi:hypothetical protein
MSLKRTSKYERHSNPTAIIPKADLAAAHGPAGRIAQVILDVDLRNSHDGLMEIAKKKGIGLKDLKPGQYLVFVNLNRDRFKIFAPAPNGRGAIIVYYRAYQGRVDRESIETIPQAFGLKRGFETGPKLAARLDEKLPQRPLRQL